MLPDPVYRMGLLIKCCDLPVVSSLLGGQLAGAGPWCVPGSVCALPSTAALPWQLLTAPGSAVSHISLENATAEPELLGCELEHLLSCQK